MNRLDRPSTVSAMLTALDDAESRRGFSWRTAAKRVAALGAYLAAIAYFAWLGSIAIFGN